MCVYIYKLRGFHVYICCVYCICIDLCVCTYICVCTYRGERAVVEIACTYVVYSEYVLIICMYMYRKWEALMDSICVNVVDTSMCIREE